MKQRAKEIGFMRKRVRRMPQGWEDREIKNTNFCFKKPAEDGEREYKPSREGLSEEWFSMPDR